MLFSTTILVAVNSFHVSLFPFVIFTFVWIALQANQLVFVKNLDSTIHWINIITIQRRSIWETKFVIHWKKIYLTDSATHFLNNWGIQDCHRPNSHASCQRCF